MANKKQKANKNVAKNVVVKNETEKIDKDIVVVRFLKNHTPYIKDEIAGFDKKFANKLIDKEVAEQFKK